MNAVYILMIYLFFLQTDITEELDAINVRYTITSDTYYPYGEELGVVNVRSKLECTTICSTTDECRSVIFDQNNPANKTCTGNKWGINDTCKANNCTETRQVNYASKVLNTTVALDCRDDTDCVDGNSTCTEAMCQCQTNYGFNTTIQACDPDDTTSGPTGGKTGSKKAYAFEKQKGQKD